MGLEFKLPDGKSHKRDRGRKVYDPRYTSKAAVRAQLPMPATAFVQLLSSLFYLYLLQSAHRRALADRPFWFSTTDWKG